MNENQGIKKCKKPRFRPEEFWLNNWRVLYNNNNYLKFVPKEKMTRIEQLNSSTRFIIYFVILVLLFNFDQRFLYLAISGIVIIVIMYYLNTKDVDGNYKQLYKILKNRIIDKEKFNDKISEQLKHDGENEVTLDIDKQQELQNYELQAGFIDSNGELFIGKKTKIPNYNPSDNQNPIESLYTADEIEEFKRNTCKLPTINNPFMNTNVTDFNDGDKPVACNSYDEDIKDDIKIKFNHELFQDVDEIWERVNSQRQFYTIPNTAVPNNQVEFAKWLYKIPKTCKENPSYGRCLRYENIKFNRSPNPY